MDWTLAIERNHEALKRILASLVAMIGFSSRDQFILALEEALVPGNKPSPALIISRRLYLEMLRLLRPAEAAARRLIVIAARGIAVTLPPRRIKPEQASPFGRSGPVVVPPAKLPRPALRSMCLPIADTLPSLTLRRCTASNRAMPRVMSLDFGALAPFGVSRSYAAPIRRPLSPNDPVDATRLTLRLQALGRVLDDLPKQALRFARWKARRDAGRVRRFSPLRPGRPPGSRRKPTHEVHAVLGDLQHFARCALEQPDTS